VSSFIRFNQGQVRQAGDVQQVYVTLSLYQGQRHAEHKLALSGVLDEDVPLLLQALQRLRGMLPTLSEDPYLRLNRQAWRSESMGEAIALDSAAMAQQIVAARLAWIWSAFWPWGRSTRASPVPGAPSAGMPRAVSTSSSACSTATARP
jgi:hypothetical protein